MSASVTGGLIQANGTTAASSAPVLNITNADPCYASVLSYGSANLSWYNANVEVLTVPTTTIYGTSYSLIPPQPFTTLCDGRPRVHGEPSYLTFNTTATTVYQSTSTVPFPGTAPSCSLPATDCSQWWQSYFTCSLSLVSYSQSLISTTIDPTCTVIGSMAAPCASPASLTFANRENLCGPCFLQANSVELNYWPVTTVGGNVCGLNGSTITRAPTPVQTAVVGGTTFTSPDVAISINEVYAWDQCGAIGSTIPDVVVTLPQDSVSSVVAYQHIIADVYPVNYADFISNRVPYSAWLRQQYCASEYQGYTTGSAILEDIYCGTIWPDYYAPQLSAPSQLFDLQPQWASCLPVFPLADPPQALQWVATVAVPTVAAKTTAVAAASVVDGGAPKTTYTALSENTPSATSAVGDNDHDSSSQISQKSSVQPESVIIQTTSTASRVSDKSSAQTGSPVVHSTWDGVALVAVKTGSGVWVGYSQASESGASPASKQTGYILSQGETTTMGGHSISVGKSAVVVDGTKTVSLPSKGSTVDVVTNVQTAASENSSQDQVSTKAHAGASVRTSSVDEHSTTSGAIDGNGDASDSSKPSTTAEADNGKSGKSVSDSTTTKAHKGKGDASDSLKASTTADGHDGEAGKSVHDSTTTKAHKGESATSAHSQTTTEAHESSTRASSSTGDDAESALTTISASKSSHQASANTKDHSASHTKSSSTTTTTTSSGSSSKVLVLSTLLLATCVTIISVIK